MYSEVGRRLRQLRTHHELTQTEVASRVGIDQSDLSHIERGEYRIRLDVLLEILAVFEVSVAEFFDETEPEALTPAAVVMLRDFAQLSGADQAAVRSLLRFKLGKR